MRSRVVEALLVVLLLAVPVSAQSAKPREADLVFRNGAVYTMDAARSWASAVAVANGRIVYVGTDKGAEAWTGPRTKVVDLGGRMVLPGFEDSHVHPVEGGIDLGRCVLNDFTTEKQILDAVADYAAKNPTKPWVLGAGWQLPVFPKANPSKTLLDTIVPDRPVFLDAADGHSAWVNSKALALAGITKETKDPPNGRIERDPATGEPSGTLREAAKGLVSSKIPPPTLEDRVEGLRRALAMANRFGITTLMEANASENELEAYAELDRRGELSARVVAALETDPARGVAQVPGLVTLRRKYQGPHLRANAVKLFADGVIESHTAALIEPYLGTNGDRGKANFEPEALDELVAALDREGFQVHVHAIGDRAIRMSLDAFERARAANGPRDSRHHIAHLELIDPKDIPRFRALGVIANFQPLWAFPDTYITDLTVPVLGPERSRWLYPIASVARTGAVVVCGSDWSVSSMNPLDAIQVAVTRHDPALPPGAPWIPEELVDLPTMLAGYTINGAYVNFQERETGSIEEGKAADLVVLDHNLFDVAPSEIHTTKVLLTLLEGKEVYRDPAFATTPDHR